MALFIKYNKACTYRRPWLQRENDISFREQWKIMFQCCEYLLYSKLSIQTYSIEAVFISSIVQCKIDFSTNSMFKIIDKRGKFILVEDHYKNVFILFQGEFNNERDSTINVSRSFSFVLGIRSWAFLTSFVFRKKNITIVYYTLSLVRK